MDKEKKQKLINRIYVLSILSLILISLTISVMKHGELDDYYYMKATGDYLITNHFSYEAFHTNPFTVNELNIVIQQWAYCVIISIINAYQPMSIIIFVLLFALLGIFTMFFYGKTNGLSDQQIIILVAVLFFLPTHIYSPRPEMLSIVLLFLQIILTEQAIKKDLPKLFYFLPFIMLIEINFHGSFWFFHYLFLLPYTVPSIFGSFAVKHSITGKKNFLHLGMAIIAMTAAMLINPYGIQMPLYIIRSLAGKTFSYIKISEMIPPEAYSSSAALIYITWMILGFGIAKKKLRSSTIYFTIGLTFISLFAKRNLMFVIFPLILILCDFFTVKRIMRQVKLSVKTIVPLLIVLPLFGVLLFYEAKERIIENNWIDSGGFPKIEAYLEKHTKKDTPIFATNTGGSYLEYYGFTKIYTDTRPEIYLKTINEKKDVLIEYDNYCRKEIEIGVDIYGKSKRKSEPLTTEEMEEFIQGYDFQYFVLTRYENILLGYLSFSGDYEKIMTDGNYDLFHRKP